MSRIVNPVTQILNSVGGGVLMALMFLTAADVILRYVFKRPIASSYELTEVMLAIVVILGLAYTGMRKQHVRVDFLINRFSPRVQGFVYSITTILSIGIIGLISWQSIKYAGLLKTGGYTTTILSMPIYPFVWVVVFGSAIFAVVLVVDLFNFLAQLAEKGRWLVRAVLLLGVVLISAIFAIPTLMPLQVSPLTVGWWGTVFLIVMLFSGMHIGTVMGIAGFLGMVSASGLKAGLAMMGTSPYSTVSAYSWSVMPMFVLMGVFCYHSGIIRELFSSMHKWLGRLPGGVAMASVVGCAGFGAVCGSSAATAATLATVALPEMRRLKYNPGLATGVLAAGGSIGAMIPPSLLFIVYAVLTESSMGKLFLAGFLPGIMQAIFYVIVVYIMCKRNPLMGPSVLGERISFTEKLASLKGSWGVLVLFLLVIGGIYGGIFTVIEAAGIGAFGAFLILLGRRAFTWKSFKDSLNETTRTTSMGMLILIGAMLFNYFLAVSRLPFALTDIVSGLAVNRYVILGVILVIYLFLGCIMSGIAMITLTIPIFFPIIVSLDFDPIWFGILVTRMCEIGVITPPVGINVYIITGIAKDIPMSTVFRGVVPFLYADLVQTVLLVAFPQISLFIPNFMKG